MQPLSECHPELVAIILIKYTILNKTALIFCSNSRNYDAYQRPTRCHGNRNQRLWFVHFDKPELESRFGRVPRNAPYHGKSCVEPVDKTKGKGKYQIVLLFFKFDIRKPKS